MFIKGKLDMKLTQGLKWVLVFIMLVAVATVKVYAAGDPQAGKAKSATCVACHQADGNSAMPVWPKIAGQQQNYIYQQLQAFRKGQDGGRYDPSMTPLMAGLSDQDMQDLAAYFAMQKTTIGSAQKDTLAQGEQLYRGGNLSTHVTACVACHGPKGLGNNEARFPRLSGQHPDYVIKQLKAFRDGTRNDGNSVIMMAIAKRMTDKEMEAVANYVSGLH